MVFYSALNCSESILATISEKARIHIHQIEKERSKPIEIPRPVLVKSQVVQIQFHHKSPSTLYVLYQDALLVYNINKLNSPLRKIDLADFAWERICPVPSPGRPDLVVVTAKNNVLVIDIQLPEP